MRWAHARAFRADRVARQARAQASSLRRDVDKRQQIVITEQIRRRCAMRRTAGQSPPDALGARKFGLTADGWNRVGGCFPRRWFEPRTRPELSPSDPLL